MAIVSNGSNIQNVNANGTNINKVIIDGTEINPDFDMTSHAIPYVKTIKLKKFSPSRIAENAGEIIGDSFKLMQFFPSDMRELLHIAKQGKMSLNLKISGLDKILETHDQTSNRIAFAIIIAALIMGSAQLINSNVPPLIYG